MATTPRLEAWPQSSSLTRTQPGNPITPQQSWYQAMCQKIAHCLVYIRYAMRLYILSWRKDFGTFNKSRKAQRRAPQLHSLPLDVRSKFLTESAPCKLVGNLQLNLKTHFFSWEATDSSPHPENPARDNWKGVIWR